jgi:hypothetical protein
MIVPAPVREREFGFSGTDLKPLSCMGRPVAASLNAGAKPVLEP